MIKKKKKKKTTEKWETKRWNSGLEGKVKERKKKKKKKSKMEGKINKYFFSLLLYLSHVWRDILDWVGPYVDRTLNGEHWQWDDILGLF